MRYKGFIIKNNIEPENSFEYLYKNFLPTIAKYDFLVDWKKVQNNRLNYEIELNILNSLIGKCDNEFYLTLKKIIKT